MAAQECESLSPLLATKPLSCY